MSTIDSSKKYRTRSGREIVIHATDGPIGGRPVVVSRKDTDGRWHLDSYPADGKDANGMGEFDLIEVREWWELIYGNGLTSGVRYGNRLAAEQALMRNQYSPNAEIIFVREVIEEGGDRE